MAPDNIWKIRTTTVETPLGTLYFCGFMNMFGAAVDFEWKAVKRMQVATPAQVYYAIEGAFS